MTALGKLFRTTAFKLSLIYLIVFVLFAGFVLGYVAFNARELLLDQVRSTIAAETSGLAEQYRLGGIRRLIVSVDRRIRRPGASLYLVTTFAGERLAGNIGDLPADALDEAGTRVIEYSLATESEERRVNGRALAQVYVLPGGFRLLVGRDLEEQDRLRDVMRRAIGLSVGLITLLAVVGGWFITRRVLKRVDDMTASAQTIMAGDIAGRLPVAGTGDELDRLAQNLNTMLDRIGELMSGLKEVSDNIAHDLKTPLTRLRNRAEEALRTARTPEQYAQALEGTIEESDNLIRIFNALLMIARLEAGGGTRETMTDFDAAEVARSVADLYEPLAEEAGMPMIIDVQDHLPVHGSRELLSQAMANLVDNALKYAAPAGGALPSADVGSAGAGPGAASGATPAAGAQLSVTACRRGDRIELVVADRGMGIPDGEREHVLERFVRLEGARSRPGFGLGLSLAAAVARLHGGKLRLEDNQPGLRAVIELPLKAAA
ncbi:ATP-binding protein [Chelatococcus reniformis]|uniref:histidine kinase n=1 Tax=Chelatococcus reniformis TaxID=1494448 RepID=A0A916UHT8_9HYPH|nr:ATP-binding protein [Chelatococcus reniformis]GGC73538.1 two-component sensor histidine kinase [Chelatococcus reniformis]